MSKLLYVDLNNHEDEYNFPEAAKIGDIYLAGNTMADLTTGLYKENYYVLLEKKENGYLVAPFENFYNECIDEVEDTTLVKLLKPVCSYKNIEVFYRYVYCTIISDFFEKQIWSRPFGTQIKWVKRSKGDININFFTKEYKDYKGIDEE